MTVPNAADPRITEGIAVEAFQTGLTDPSNTTNGETGAVVSDPNVNVSEPQNPSVPDARFTTEDITKARREEKDKLYSRLETMNSELDVLRKEREERAATEAAAEAEREAERKRLAEEGMTVKELLAAKEHEWNERLAQLEKEREADRMLLERERQFNELQSYKTNALANAGDAIIPDLLDMVNGNTPDEIDASIALLTERSNRILEGVTQAAQQQRQAMRTVSPTGAAPVGPMDNNPNYETITAEDISGMDMQTYAKNRERLMKAASRRDRGLFG